MPSIPWTTLRSIYEGRWYERRWHLWGPMASDDFTVDGRPPELIIGSVVRRITLIRSACVLSVPAAKPGRVTGRARGFDHGFCGGASHDGRWPGPHTRRFRPGPAGGNARGAARTVCPPGAGRPRVSRSQSSADRGRLPLPAPADGTGAAAA